MILIKNGKSESRILTVKETPALKRAAEILASWLGKVTGFTPKINDEPSGSDIYLDTVPFATPFPACGYLGEEGFLIAEKDGNIYIYAASDAAAGYAVYDFLERFAGCLWLTSTVDYFTHLDSITVPDNTFIRSVPAINYREVYYRDSWSPDYAEKQKINGQASYIENGKIHEKHKNWGFWCHSFFTLVPPKEHFATHPEYYSLVNGKRVDNGQLCCSNDNMIATAIARLGEFIKEKPDLKYWSVSQNDTALPCECEKCKKLDEEAGSHIGSIIYFVNKVAEAFPDKIISTLAYWYSRTAPTKLSVRNNVHIMLCNIECDRSAPIDSNPKCADFMRDISIWAKYCEHIFLWDYDIQFSNLVSPFPNIKILAPNMRFFQRANVRAIFNQANRETRGDLWALRQYLLAKLSWDPYCDAEKHKSDFLSAYYGKAAPYVREYIDLTEAALDESGEGLSIFGKPAEEAFLSRGYCLRYRAILSDAKNAVAGDSELVLRVEEVEMGVVYAMLKGARYESEAEKAELLTFFERVSSAVGLEKVEEWKVTRDAFIESFKQ